MTLESLLLQVAQAPDHFARARLVRQYADPLELNTRTSDSRRLAAEVSSWQPHEDLGKVLAPLYTVLLLNCHASMSTATLMLRRLTEHTKQEDIPSKFGNYTDAVAAITQFYEDTDMPCECHHLREFLSKSLFIPFRMALRIGTVLFPGREPNQYMSGSNLIQAMFRDGCYVEEDRQGMLQAFDTFVRQTPLDSMATLLREAYYPPSENHGEFAKTADRFLSSVFDKRQPSVLMLFNHVDEHSYLAKICDLPDRFDGPDEVHTWMQARGTRVLEIESESFEAGSRDFYERAASARSRGRAWVASRTSTSNVVQFRPMGGHR